MREILLFLTRFGIPLFECYGFKIIGSQAKGANTGSILLESDDVRIFLAHGRGEFCFDFCSLYDSKKNNWYSIDLIVQLLGGQPDSGLLTDANCLFFSEHMGDILNRFSKEKLAETLKTLNKLKQQRCKRL